jgi:hypothetical protein
VGKERNLDAVFDDLGGVIEKGDAREIFLLFEEPVLQLLELMEHAFLLQMETVREQQ